MGVLSVILNNEALGTGIVHTNRYIYTTEKSPTTGKPIQKFIGERPRDQWVSVQVPKIFSEEEYGLLREKLESNKRYRMIKRDHFLSVLSTKIWLV